MWYILNMNKDVIYIEPEDDITDIITKIENAKEKIVALVPPKKAGVFRSLVNIKLISKASNSAEKKVVLVTTDPSIVKLAAAVKMPVTKNLQTAPVIPKDDEEAEIESTEKEELEENLGDEEEEEKAKETEEEDEASAGEIADKEEEKEEKKEEKAEGKKKGKKKSDSKLPAWFVDHKKLIIFGSIFGVVLILVLIWALVIAPAVTITVGVRTNKNNFSENVTFTTALEEEKTDEGKFYLDEKKLTTKSEVEFEATGKKNIGEKATGDVIVYHYFKKSGSVAINAGSKFTLSDLTFVSGADASLSWDGKNMSVCGNQGQPSIVFSGCLVSGRVSVTAAAPGSNYNVAASNTGWNTAADVSVYSDKAMSGGTDVYATVVTQADIDKAKESLTSSNEAENKAKLTEDLDETTFILDSSFVQVTSDATSTPAIGEEVKEGEKALLSATTIATIFVIDKTKVEEFITEKAKISESQKVYEIRNPFIESFIKTDAGYTGKLKTSYISGPRITENDVIEIIKGKGLGEAQHDIKDIDGISSIRIDKSYPWVMSIPSDPNKITVILDVQVQE